MLPCLQAVLQYYDDHTQQHSAAGLPAARDVSLSIQTEQVSSKNEARFHKKFDYASTIERQQTGHAYIKLILAVDICFLLNEVFHNTLMTARSCIVQRSFLRQKKMYSITSVQYVPPIQEQTQTNIPNLLILLKTTTTKAYFEISGM